MSGVLSASATRKAVWPRGIGGGTERRSRFGQQSDHAVTDGNSVVSWTAQRQAFDRLRDAFVVWTGAARPAHTRAVAGSDPAAPTLQLRNCAGRGDGLAPRASRCRGVLECCGRVVVVAVA